MSFNLSEKNSIIHLENTVFIIDNFPFIQSILKYHKSQCKKKKKKKLNIHDFKKEKKITHIHYVFILTHFHADHFNGFSKSSFNRKSLENLRDIHGIHISIGMSDLTSRLVYDQLNIDSKLCKVLYINQEYVVSGYEIRDISTNDEYEICDDSNTTNDFIRLKIFNAGHCYGSISLLITSVDGYQIFHTGDFRFSRDGNVKGQSSQFSNNIFKEYIHDVNLYSNIDLKIIDKLYIDTTYWRCGDFPSQRETIRCCVDEVKCLCLKYSKTFIFIGSYNFGKERLLFSLADSFSQKSQTIYIPNTKRYDILVNAFPELTRIFSNSLPEKSTDITFILCRLLDLQNEEYIREIVSSFTIRENITSSIGIIRISPTGWNSSKNEVLRKRNFLGKKESYIQLSQDTSIPMNSIIVPYSEHSSHFELCQFLKEFRSDCEVISTVPGSNWDDGILNIGQINTDLHVSSVSQQKKMTDYFNGI